MNDHRKQYGAIIFDCDGVLLDTNHAKIQAFRDCAIEADFDPDTVERFSEWQSQNFGLSRGLVFEKLLSGSFGEAPNSASLHDLIQSFGHKSRSLYGASVECQGVRELLDHLQGHPLFVASGSDQSELRNVLREKRLSGYFRMILGSPTSKVDNVNKIVSHLEAEFQSLRTVMIGDSLADYEAAKINNIEFVFVSRYSTATESMGKLALEGQFSAVDNLDELRQKIL